MEEWSPSTGLLTPEVRCCQSTIFNIYHLPLCLNQSYTTLTHPNKPYTCADGKTKFHIHVSASCISIETEYFWNEQFKWSWCSHTVGARLSLQLIKKQWYLHRATSEHGPRLVCSQSKLSSILLINWSKFVPCSVVWLRLTAQYKLQQGTQWY